MTGLESAEEGGVRQKRRRGGGGVCVEVGVAIHIVLYVSMTISLGANWHVHRYVMNK